MTGVAGRTTTKKTATRMAAWLVAAGVGVGAGAFGGGAPASAAAPPKEAKRADVLALLSGFEYTPTKDELDRLGGGVETQMMSIALDEGAWLVARGRALALLGWYPTAPVVKFLEERLGDVAADFYVKRYAMAGLARATGAAAPARAFDALRPLLADKDFRVREGAAYYLRQVCDPRVLGALREHLAVERHAAVKPTLLESIRVVEAR
jgi:HEAT repeat protein